jgi:isochorismate synthase EntC
METRQPTIEGLNFTNFLESGALLRPSANLWFLLQGPFTATTTLSHDAVALFHPDFFMSDKDKYWIPHTLIRCTDQDLRQLLIKEQQAQLEVNSSLDWQWQSPDFAGFEISFQQISERMQTPPQQQTLKKAVPIAFENSNHSLTGKDRAKLLQSLLDAPANLYVYGFWQNGGGVLGATPEVLLRQDGEALTTMALAGTCPKEDLGSRQSLLEDPKERHEHDLVAQDIVQALRKYGQIRTEGPKLLELPTLFHLKTDISCTLLNSGAFDFFEACKLLHPTPALGVSPRSYGIAWMKDLPEQSTRKGFGAPWGLKWSQHEALCLVAIRNIQWDNRGSRIGAGCGIVAQSNLQQEWRELFQKRLSVKRVLGLQS